jgi:hypothetical protein
VRSKSDSFFIRKKIKPIPKMWDVISFIDRLGKEMSITSTFTNNGRIWLWGKLREISISPELDEP